jgi:hypothetical protein
MRKATDARESDDLGRVRRLGFGESTCWGIANRRVDPIAVGVPDVLSEQASEEVFAEHDDVIEQLPANAPPEALRGPVLPPASEFRALGVDAEAFDREGDLGREDHPKGAIEGGEPWLAVSMGVDRELLSERKLDDGLVLATPEEGDHAAKDRGPEDEQRPHHARHAAPVQRTKGA